MRTTAASHAFYTRIVHPDGRAYYAGGPLSLADAQILLNDAIAGRAVPAGSYLRVDGPHLVLEPAPRPKRPAVG